MSEEPESLVGAVIRASLIVLGVILVLDLLHRSWRRMHLPPGPLSLPIVGSLPFITGDLLEVFAELRKKHGDVFTVDIGGDTTVVLNGYDVIKTCFVTHGQVTKDRPPSFLSKELLKNKGILSRNGREWKDVRSFMFKVLRNFGLGSSKMEERIKQEIDCLSEEIMKTNGASFDPWRILQWSVGNVVRKMATGQREDLTEKKSSSLADLFDRMLLHAAPESLLSLFPFLSYFPGDMFGYQSLKEVVDDITRILQGHIDRHKETMCDDNVTDLIDAFLVQIKLEENKADSVFTEDELVSVLIDFLVAGTETTAATIYWACLVLGKSPDVQNRLARELEDAAGPRGIIPYSDRQYLPYTMAFIQELQRLSDVDPVASPHVTSGDVTVSGYVIPAGVTLIPNIHSVQHDETLWPDPEVFDPQRHLDVNGVFTKRDEVISFSLGPRACVGEGLARMEIFLFLTILVRQFRIQPADGASLPSFKAKSGLPRKPSPFQIAFIPRKHD